MDDLSFDLDRPPDEPPAEVVQVMLWRVAARLHRDHDLAVRDRWGSLMCELCRQPWPCPGRRLSQRALIASCRPAIDPAGAAGYVDRTLSAVDLDQPGAFTVAWEPDRNPEIGPDGG